MIEFLMHLVEFIAGLLTSGFGLIIGLVGLKIIQTGLAWCF